jgi:hypothetical protein
MHLRTIAMLATLIALPVTAAAQGHNCGCCANHQASHESHGCAMCQAARSTPPQARAATPGTAPAYHADYEGLFAGTVESVMRHAGMDVQLTVGAGEATYEVLVAPMDWLDRQNVAFRTGEKVDVVGARQDAATPNVIVAREIRSASQTVVLRDADGRPLWK